MNYAAIGALLLLPVLALAGLHFEWLTAALVGLALLGIIASVGQQRELFP